MATKIFVNLPVRDLNASIQFFSRLGYKFNQQFTDEKAACMIIGDDIFVMLLVENFFKTFTKKPVVDATKATEMLLCLSAESKAKVDELVEKAERAGAQLPDEPQDQGFMYSRNFTDLDGHIWEIMYMDPAAISGSQS
ncbi:MAG: VOC family protein [Chitinophagaceae bacterium]|nr:VOC family protein [Chitinophagaceae bacterium]